MPRASGATTAGSSTRARACLAECRERGRWIGERIDHQRRPVGLDLHSRPAKPPNSHRFLAFVVYRTIVRYIILAMPRRSQAAVAETRAAVTQAAVDRASVEGLEGLTIGGLAGETEMRKSSVFSLFGSKEELQRAALDAAVEQFTEEVWGPVADEEPGATSAARPLRQLARLPPRAR